MPHPNEGGCWYCHKDDGEMVFSCEFDTYLHMECLLKEYQLCKSEDLVINRELQIMMKELCPEYKENTDARA